MFSFASSEADNGHEALSASHRKMGLSASLRKRENATLLGLVLVATLAYVALQSIRQRLSEKRAFERKRRLLGISSSAIVSSSSSHAANISTEAKGLGTALSTGATASICKYSWTLLQLLHLDTCFKYVQEASPPSVKRLFSQKTRRRKDKAATTDDHHDSNTATKDSRGRGGTITSSSRSSPSSSTSPAQAHQKSSLSNPNPTPNSPHSPAARQGARRQGSSNTHASASSSRNRTGTNNSSQHQQQQRAVNAVTVPAASQASQVVMKHIGIQVSLQDLLDFPIHRKVDGPSQEAAVKAANGRSYNGETTSLATSSDAGVRPTDAKEGEMSDLDMACAVPLPSDNDGCDVSSAASSICDADHTLSRHGTITSRTARSSAQQSASKQSPSAKKAVAVPQLAAPPARRSDTKDSMQSPTCSSSGRSTSLSVSTDATGLTSVRDEQEGLPSLSKNSMADVHQQAVLDSHQQHQKALQPAVHLKSGKTASSVHNHREQAASIDDPQKSPSRPALLSYSFHTGFQEPTTLEDGEAVGYSPMMSSPQQSRQGSTGSSAMPASDPDLYLPSPPDSQRRIRVDAMGYPSIPIPPTASSATSSAQNSPSSARRAVSVPRPVNSPSSSALPNSPDSERKPSNAQAHHKLQRGMYPESLGVQSPSLYGHMPTSPPPPASPAGPGGYTASFPGMPLASPGSQQQHQQAHQYMAQKQFQYQLQQQVGNPSIPATVNGHSHLHAGQPPAFLHSALQSPAMAPQPSPGFLNPMHVYTQRPQGAHSSSGGSNRSSVHMALNSQVSSRSTSPQPSSAYSYSTEHNSSNGASTVPTEGNFSVQAEHVQYPQDTRKVSQSHDQHSQTQNQLDLVQKMMLMQAQIQYAMQQNALQSQQSQAHQQSFQSTASFPGSPSSMGVSQAPYSTTGPSLPSPFLQSSDGQQAFLLSGISSPLGSSSYPYTALGGGQSPGIASPYQQYASPYSYQQGHPVAGPSSATAAGYHVPSFPTVRRRQSTPAMGADSSISGIGTSQVSSNGSPFGNSKRRNRRNSRPFRMSSQGQAFDGPDYLTSLNQDTSAHYDAEVDMSTTSSSYHSTSRPNYDRRRSSLIPPPSPLLDSRKARRARQRERERERLRQLELDDEEITKNEDDIKADLEILAQMQEQEDKDREKSWNADEVMTRLKSMETVLERRGKELEIARWKLKCVEVDRRSIEAEHQKALAHFYERAERAEARLRLVDNATTAPTDGPNGKGSPEVSLRQLHNAASSQGDSSVLSEASQADSDSAAASLNFSFSSTTPHLPPADFCSPTSLTSASYHFSDSPYTSSKYPPHPFASGFKLSRRGRRSPRNARVGYREFDESGNSTLSPRGKDFALDATPSNRDKSAGVSGESASSETSDSEEDIEILLDSSYSRSPSIQPSVPHSRVPSGGILDGSALASTDMTESKTVGLGIESSSSSTDGSKPVRKAPVEFVGSLPSFTISQPPASPSQNSDDTKEAT